MSLNYTTFLSSLAALAVNDPANTDFLAMVPNAIDYAEQRMYRELDLLTTWTGLAITLTANQSILTIPIPPTGKVTVVDFLELVNPAKGGARDPVIAASEQYLAAAFPGPTGTGIPRYFARVHETLLRLGPWPDLAYTGFLIGKIRPNPLAAANPTTYLATSLPDAFLACAMIHVTAWQKNFGAQSDDPKGPVSWESQYKTLMSSIAVEEQRKRFASSAWSSQAPTPVATPTR